MAPPPVLCDLYGFIHWAGLLVNIWPVYGVSRGCRSLGRYGLCSQLFFVGHEASVTAYTDTLHTVPATPTTIAFSIVNQWFSSKEGIATGCVTLGAAVGGIFFSLTL